jgi:hypothetical protein
MLWSEGAAWSIWKTIQFANGSGRVGNDQSRKRKIVGYKHQPFVVLDVEVANPPQFFGIIFLGVETLKRNNLIGLDTRCFVDRQRIKTLKIEIDFGPGDEKG